ncbi:MAG: hydrogenase expression/formation protein HypE [Candidatus Hydrogenedentota bacterium]
MPDNQEPIACGTPFAHAGVITMAHGGGGTAMHRLLNEVFLPVLENPMLAEEHDAARLQIGTSHLAFTTDTYVVQPLTFPGGDIGTLAVNGTVNDLAMAGAKPLYLSAGFILEEGFPIAQLHELVRSMRNAADAAGVSVVTGDTKVIERRGGGDGVFINTAGVGIIEHELEIGPGSVRPEDAILVSGDIGRHGIAVMAKREGLEFDTTLESDCACVAAEVLEMLDAGIEVHCLRDLTRGGLVSAANEIALGARLNLHLREAAIPVGDAVRGACEMLGFDPLSVANEGRFIAIVRHSDAGRAHTILRKYGGEAAIIGEIRATPAAQVTIESAIGASRVLDMLSGEQLPRIC